MLQIKRLKKYSFHLSLLEFIKLTPPPHPRAKLFLPNGKLLQKNVMKCNPAASLLPSFTNRLSSTGHYPNLAPQKTFPHEFSCAVICLIGIVHKPFMYLKFSHYSRGSISLFLHSKKERQTGYLQMSFHSCIPDSMISQNTCFYIIYK